MVNQDTDKLQLQEQFSDILLVLDKKKKKIEVVKGIGSDNKLQTVTPDKKNQSQFMRVDKHGDLFSNFFSNFLHQLKDPTHFNFFRVSARDVITVAKKIQNAVDSSSIAGKKLLAQYEIKTDYKQLNKYNMETKQSTSEVGEYRFKLEQIDWKAMSNMGINKERLEKMNLIDPLLKGYKTNELVPISLNLGNAVTRMDARLSLQSNDEGKVIVAIHGIRKEPQLNFPFFGHEFTKEDKDNLLKTGNMGRVVNLTNPKTDEIIPSIVSVDRLTNELVALRSNLIKIPDEIKGVKLDEQQKQSLMDGKSLYIEGMTSKKGEPFNASVQFNADKRYVEFLFDRSNTNKQSQSQQQSRSEQQEVPRTFRGKELDDQQYQKFKEGQTVYVTGLVDKNGKDYQGYITFNKETAKTGFSFENPNKTNDKAQSKGNSEAKNSEATKNGKEPEKAAQEKPKTAAKSKVPKM
ncbi:DUF3945 domain-containing protein [Flavobacterium eburneipallidum]|uniref:DUF3945 domain-containing protein n=1 Tax=Flavobacterium eburneipallidum TaxID=3003263 RepID=UPI0024829CBB|nr:DUF4099 domain-containing protein [Flavobacterium eburneipallidum]